MAQDESRKIGTVDVDAFRRILHVDELGFVSTPEVESLTGQGEPLDMRRIGDRFAYGLSKRGGDMYSRVRAIDERVTKNSVRPEGSTPVRGSGLRKFGSAVGLGLDVAEAEKQRSKIERRRDKIREDQRRNYDTMMSEMASEDPRLQCIANCEQHQLMTGGGYDNTTPTDYYTTIWNFFKRAESLPTLDADARQAIVDSCVEFREHLIECGFRLGSLKPTPFVQVRVDQQQMSKDGTMGWPILKRSLLPFTDDEADAIMSQYDIDLHSWVGAEVDDGFGYKGPCRCADAVAKLISEFDYTPNNMLPLYVLFQRIQRHGWSSLEGEAVVKNGKARAIYVPDVVWGGGVGAMVMDAWQRELEAHHIPDFPSLMNPDDQKRTIFEMVANAAVNDCVVLSTDESGYDQSLRSDIMATIMWNCVRPFFEEEYHPYVDIATLSFVCKVLVVDEQQFSAVPKMGNENMLRYCVNRDRHTLLPVARGGLVSGHKGTMSMGSMYGRIVCQKTALKMLGAQLPDGIVNDGVMAGDDNAMVVPRQFLNMESEASVYGEISEVYNKFGIEVNPNKQLWVVADDEPVCQFLQKIYHSKLEIRGIGSAARVLQQVDFAEYSPAHLNTAEQAMAQISVMENGYDNPFIKTAVRLWLESDPKLTYLFQTFGSEAFRYLTRDARMDDPIIVQSILNLETKGANGLQRNASDAATDINLHIVPIIADVAASLPPSRERWDSPKVSYEDQSVSASDEAIDAGADESLGESTEEV